MNNLYSIRICFLIFLQSQLMFLIIGFLHVLLQIHKYCRVCDSLIIAFIPSMISNELGMIWSAGRRNLYLPVIIKSRNQKF